MVHHFCLLISSSKFFIWISAEVRSCALQYVFLSTKSPVVFWSHYALEVAYSVPYKLHILVCGSPVMRTTVCFSFNKIRRWLLVALCFGSGVQCTLQAAHFSLAFSLLVFFPLSVLQVDMTDQSERVKGHRNSIKTGQKAVSIDRMPKTY